MVTAILKKKKKKQVACCSSRALALITALALYLAAAVAVTSVIVGSELVIPVDGAWLALGMANRWGRRRRRLGARPVLACACSAGGGRVGRCGAGGPRRLSARPVLACACRVSRGLLG